MSSYLVSQPKRRRVLLFCLNIHFTCAMNLISAKFCHICISKRLVYQMLIPNFYKLCFLSLALFVMNQKQGLVHCMFLPLVRCFNRVGCWKAGVLLNFNPLTLLRQNSSHLFLSRMFKTFGFAKTILFDWTIQFKMIGDQWVVVYHI